MGKIDILMRAVRGELLKRAARHISDKELKKLQNSTPVVPVVVSLTSYGERVEKTLPAVVVSLLRQSVRAEKIVVWLDEETWNDSNIPADLSRLIPYGVEVRYIKNVRSYKKLVYSLGEFADKTIITVDDDLYYSKDLVKELYDAHIANPQYIICMRYRFPIIDFESGTITPYKEWGRNIPDGMSKADQEKLMFPIGYGGILYPPGALHHDATNEEMYMKLAPYADDVWFYVMGILNHTPKMTIPEHKSTHYFIDLFRQVRTRDRLFDTNVGESRNDTQLRAALEHYKLIKTLNK